MTLLQQHDGRWDILIEPAARRRAAIKAWGHSEVGLWHWGCNRAVKTNRLVFSDCQSASLDPVALYKCFYCYYCHQNMWLFCDRWNQHRVTFLSLTSSGHCAKVSWVCVSVLYVKAARCVSRCRSCWFKWRWGHRDVEADQSRHWSRLVGVCECLQVRDMFVIVRLLLRLLLTTCLRLAVDIIWAMVIVWRITRKFIRTVLCCIASDSCTHMNSSQRWALV